jgi:formate dehydrogenase major subunit
MLLKVKGNTIMEVNSEPDLAPNYGALCVKGRFAFNFVHSRERLTSPLICRDGVLQEASWEEAYSFIANKLTAIKEQHGPDSVAGFSCARATNEENFLMQKFMRTVIGTNNIDHCARL